MDDRLRDIHGHRPRRLTQEDCRLLARLMVDVMEGKGVVRREDHASDLRVIFLTSQNGSLIVRAEDWGLLVPYLTGPGSLGVLAPPSPGTPVVHPDVTDANDTRDQQLYGRVLAIVTGLFPAKYPVSQL